MIDPESTILSSIERQNSKPLLQKSNSAQIAVGHRQSEYPRPKTIETSIVEIATIMQGTLELKKMANIHYILQWEISNPL